jgi:hypothetical protein
MAIVDFVNIGNVRFNLIDTGSITDACKPLDAHGFGNLRVPGQPILNMDPTIAGEGAT